MAEEKSTREKFTEPPVKQKPRFRLRFSNVLETGRSALSIPKLSSFHEPLVTSKFYSAYDTSKLQENEDVWLINEEITKLRSLGPKEKYDEPVLESHRYGWFQEKFIHVNADTERVHFPKRDSEMVKVQNLLDNAAKADQLYHLARTNK